MKKLVMILLVLVAVLGLSACSYETTYTINEDGSVEAISKMWYGLDDLKQVLELSMRYMDAIGKDVDEETQNRMADFQSIETYEELLAFSEKYGLGSFSNMEKKEFNGLLFFSDDSAVNTSTYDADYMAEIAKVGLLVTPDAFRFSMKDLISFYKEQNIIGGTESTSDESYEEAMENSYFFVTVNMPKEILFTNGQLSEDKKSVYFEIDLSDTKNSFYAYTKDSDEIISLGIEDGAYTKAKSVKITTPDEIMDVKVNGESVTATEIDTKKDGQYEIYVKTANSEKTVKFIKDSKKPVVSGVKNGKTYKKDVTVTFSDDASGIKTAKLNGKKIKSGKKITKKGSYTLKVSDKAGNKTTVKFVIK